LSREIKKKGGGERESIFPREKKRGPPTKGSGRRFIRTIAGPRQKRRRGRGEERKGGKEKKVSLTSANPFRALRAIIVRKKKEGMQGKGGGKKGKKKKKKEKDWWEPKLLSVGVILSGFVCQGCKEVRKEQGEGKGEKRKEGVKKNWAAKGHGIRLGINLSPSKPEKGGKLGRKRGGEEKRV